MAKTYTALGTVAAGDVYTASAYNTMATDVNNFIVPPAVQVIRTSNVSYTASTNITWSSAAFDTDTSTPQWSSGAPTQITIQTTGLYLITGSMQVTGTATLTSMNADVYKNGTLISRQIFPPNSTSTGGYVNPTIISSCTAGDTLTFQIGLTGGSAFSLVGSATESNNQSRVTVMWIGRTS